MLALIVSTLAKAALARLAPGLKKVAIYAGIILIGLLPVIGAGVWFIYHERHIGAAQCEAEVKTATDNEKARQLEVNRKAQEWADRMVRLVSESKAKDDVLLRKIAAMSASNHSICLSADVVRELRAIGRPSG